jgi:lipopolysaccharide export system permease protein
VPLFATLTIAAMLLVLDKMLRLFDFVATEGGPVSVVWRMLANLLPEYLSLGIPIGLLMGILLAFRKLALSSELDVFRAVGLSYFRLLRVPILFATVLAIINFAIVGFAQPYSRYSYERLRYELRSGALGASIKVGEFANLGKRMTLRIERSEDDGRKLTGIFLRAKDRDNKALSVAAEKGQFLRTDDPDTIILRLTKGVLVHDAPGFKEPRILSFTSHDLPIPLPKIAAFRERGGADRERTIPDLVRTWTDPRVSEAVRTESVANFNYRLAEVAMMLLLPFLAIALAVPPKRSSSALGVFLSIVMVVTYHKINELAENMGALGKIDPVIALWVPFLLFAALILWMYNTLANVPGGQPIGGLERVFAKASARLRKLFVREAKETVA